MIEITKQEARLMARIMGTHGAQLTLFGKTISVEITSSALTAHGRRFRWWWY